MDQKLKQFLVQQVIDLIEWMKSSFQFVLGLIGVVLSTTLSLSGEIIDDLTTYKDYEVDWLHIAKVALPPVALAVGAYIQHKKAVSVALLTPPPGADGSGN